MKILAAHDGGSGCAYYRLILPLQELARHGHEVDLRSSQDNWVPDNPGEYDVIIGQRFDAHAAMGRWRRWSAVTRLVYEIDDDVFSIEPVNWMAYGRLTRADVQDAIIHQMQVSDMVVVTTPHLAEVMGEHNPNVVVINNHLPGWVLDLPDPQGERPAVGWVGGASHGLDIQLVASPLRRFLNRFPGWDAVLIGTDYRPVINHQRTGYIPWTSVVEDPEGYYRSLDFEIGLAPVQRSTFTRGKSHVKCLEYAARGIPVIASDAEPYRDFVLHGVTGFLVRHEHEWLRYMSMLANDEGMRREMGAKAREVAREWTIENGYKLWESAFSSLL